MKFFCSLSTLVCLSGILLGMSFSALSAELSEIPLVGKDKDGHSKAVFIPSQKYLEKMSTTLLAVNQSVIPQLNERVCETEDQLHYELTSVVVSLGIEFQVGLGSIFSVSTGGKMSLIYANEFDPVIPE